MEEYDSMTDAQKLKEIGFILVEHVSPYVLPDDLLDNMYDDLKRIAANLPALEEKAWQYDELCD